MNFIAEYNVSVYNSVITALILCNCMIADYTYVDKMYWEHLGVEKLAKNPINEFLLIFRCAANVHLVFLNHSMWICMYACVPPRQK